MASGMRVSGSWRNLVAPHGRVAGTWRQAQKLWARAGGVWRVVWSAVAASLTDRSVSSSAFTPSSATCYYRISTDGNAYGGGNTTNFLEQWRDEGSNPDFEVLFDPVDGTIPAATGFTYNQWTEVTAHMTMAMGRSGLGSNTGRIDVSIRDKSSQSVLTTARITMTAEVVEFPE